MLDLPFGFDQPEDSPGFLLWQTTVVWQRLIKKALEPFDLTHPQFVSMSLLMWLEENHHDTTQSALIHWSKLDKMTVSKSLKSLVLRNLVKTSEHVTDTRAKKVTLTDEGRVLICRVVPVVEKIDEDFFGNLDKERNTSLIRILKMLLK